MTTRETRLARSLRERIKARGLTPHGVSRAAGLNPNAVRDILAGKVRSARFQTVAALARVLGCRPEDLAGTQPHPRVAEDAAPFDPNDGTAALLSVIYPLRPRAFPLRALSDALSDVGVMSGDLLIVDPDIDPRDGDLAVVLFHAEDGQPTETLLREVAGPFLRPRSPNPVHMPLSRDWKGARLAGIVTRVVRHTR